IIQPASTVTATPSKRATAMKCHKPFKRIMLIFHLNLVVPMLAPLNEIRGVTVGFSFRKQAHALEIRAIKKRHRRPSGCGP
ncbi:MAG: hypothetical protein PVJ00_08190, partial [Desulfobacterales bacterium]